MLVLAYPRKSCCTISLGMFSGTGIISTGDRVIDELRLCKAVATPHHPLQGLQVLDNRSALFSSKIPGAIKYFMRVEL